MNSIFKIFIFLNNYIFRHKGSFCQSIEILPVHRNTNRFVIDILLKNLKKYKNTQFYILGCKKGCKSRKCLIYTFYCGETGIRTPGTSRSNGFQDRRNRPLCHLSKTLLGSCLVFQRRCKGRDYFLFCKQKRKKLFGHSMINQKRKIPKLEIVVLKIKNVRES